MNISETDQAGVKILVLGASGKTGKATALELLKKESQLGFCTKNR